ncbi:MAG: HAD family hydrolase [Hydrogeniiclostridium mannosilyticum]
MNQKIKTDGVLFDLDGTLWDASVPVAAGFQQAIDGHPEVKEAMTPEIMRANMGRLLDEILHHTYPYLTEEQVQSVLKDYLALGCGYIAEAGGRLFDGLEATLKTLSARSPFYCQQLPSRLYRGLFPGARPAALF